MAVTFEQFSSYAKAHGITFAICTRANQRLAKVDLATEVSRLIRKLATLQGKSEQQLTQEILEERCGE